MSASTCYRAARIPRFTRDAGICSEHPSVGATRETTHMKWACKRAMKSVYFSRLFVAIEGATLCATWFSGMSRHPPAARLLFERGLLPR